MHVGHNLLLLGALGLRVLRDQVARGKVQRVRGRQHGHQLLLLAGIVQHADLRRVRRPKLLPRRAVAHRDRHRALRGAAPARRRARAGPRRSIAWAAPAHLEHGERGAGEPDAPAGQLAERGGKAPRRRVGAAVLPGAVHARKAVQQVLARHAHVVEAELRAAAALRGPSPGPHARALLPRASVANNAVREVGRARTLALSTPWSAICAGPARAAAVRCSAWVHCQSQALQGRSGTAPCTRSP